MKHPANGLGRRAAPRPAEVLDDACWPFGRSGRRTGASGCSGRRSPSRTAELSEAWDGRGILRRRSGRCKCRTRRGLSLAAPPAHLLGCRARAIPAISRRLGRDRRSDDRSAAFRRFRWASCRRAAPGSIRFGRAWARMILARHRRDGARAPRENGSPGRSAVIAPNHESFYDILVLFAHPADAVRVSRQAQPLPDSDPRLVDAAAGFVPVDRGEHRRGTATIEPRLRRLGRAAR